MPGKPFKSKLLKYEEFIRKARQEGVSYKEIAAQLYKLYGVKAGHNTIFSFVKVRSKKRKVFTMLENNSDEKTSNQHFNRNNDNPKQINPKKTEFDLGEKIFIYDKSKPIT
jgi:hypothetical protein